MDSSPLTLCSLFLQALAYAGVPDALQPKLKANDWVNAVLGVLGGKGGGKANVAQVRFLGMIGGLQACCNGAQCMGGLGGYILLALSVSPYLLAIASKPLHISMGQA